MVKYFFQRKGLIFFVGFMILLASILNVALAFIAKSYNGFIECYRYQYRSFFDHGNRGSRVYAGDSSCELYLQSDEGEVAQEYNA